MYLVAVCFIAALGGFLFGFDTAVISGTVNMVKEQFMFSAHMEGWFVSSALVGCVIGVIFAGKLSDSFGRKIALILSSILFLISAAGCAIASTAFFLITARLIGGIGVGIASMLSPMYISEFSPPRLRGRMVTLYQFAITIGILCAYFSNALLVHIGEHYLQGTAPGFVRWRRPYRRSFFLSFYSLFRKARGGSLRKGGWKKERRYSTESRVRKSPNGK